MNNASPLQPELFDAPSVDRDEVAFYTRLAGQWWDADGPFWPLHELNRTRVPFITQQACAHLGRRPDDDHPLTGLRVLDIGCGGGILSESMAALGAFVHGIDVTERNIGIARSHAQAGGLEIEYECVSAESLAKRNVQYDIVLNMEVVEHVADLDSFMYAAAQMVRPGGMMFVATINRNWLAGLVAIFGAEYVLRWLPRGTHRYDRLRKPGEIVDQLETRGLDIRKMAGVRVNPLTRRMSLSGNTWINYMLAAYRRPAPDATDPLRAKPWEDRA